MSPITGAHSFIHSMVRGVFGSIVHGGPMDRFFVPDSDPRLVKHSPWFVLPCLWDDAYKRSFAANRKK